MGTWHDCGHCHDSPDPFLREGAYTCIKKALGTILLLFPLQVMLKSFCTSIVGQSKEGSLRYST